MKKITALSVAAILFFALFAYAGANQQVVVEIKRMTCEVCGVAVKKSLVDVQGVKSVKVSFDEKKAFLTVDPSVTDDMLIQAVKKAGSYEGKVIERK